MNDIPSLVFEFKQITEDYAKALKALDRRYEIVHQLVQTGLKHREVGVLLGISTGRAGQLVRRAAAYVSSRPDST